jgi:hypothetical protein
MDHGVSLTLGHGTLVLQRARPWTVSGLLVESRSALSRAPFARALDATG